MYRGAKPHTISRTPETTAYPLGVPGALRLYSIEGACAAVSGALARTIRVAGRVANENFSLGSRDYSRRVMTVWGPFF